MSRVRSKDGGNRACGRISEQPSRCSTGICPSHRMDSRPALGHEGFPAIRPACSAACYDVIRSGDGGTPCRYSRKKNYDQS
jgi:hypothetical protein